LGKFYRDTPSDNPSSDLPHTGGSFNIEKHDKKDEIKNILESLRDVDDISLVFIPIVDKLVNQKVDTQEIIKIKNQTDTLIKIISNVVDGKTNINETYITTLNTIFDNFKRLVNLETKEIKIICTQIINVITNSTQPNITQKRSQLIIKIQDIQTKLIVISSVPTLKLTRISKQMQESNNQTILKSIKKLQQISDTRTIYK
jgi:hypothetical protein